MAFYGICGHCGEHRDLAILGGLHSTNCCRWCFRPSMLQPLTQAEIEARLADDRKHGLPPSSGLVGHPEPGGEFTGRRK